MSNIKISTRILFRLKRNLVRNKKLKKSGIPVSGVLFYKKGLIICSSNNKNAGGKRHQTDTHAEKIILENYSTKRKPLKMIVCIPPCPDCMKILEKNNISIVLYIKEKSGKTCISDKVEVSKFVPANIKQEKLVSQIIEIINTYKRLR